MAGVGAALRAGGGLLADLLAPPRCSLCGAYGAFLCLACTAALPGDRRSRCPACMEPLGGRHGGGCAGAATSPLESATAAYHFDGAARRLVHQLKYRRLHALGQPMGTLLIPAAAALAGGVDAVIPVPLHRWRGRARGFNQSERLARPVAAALAVPLAPELLRRTRHTRRQVLQPDAAARQRNVAGAFAAGADVRGLRVLLVDDVATTGATLRACARALRDGGAVRIHALTFAAGG